MHFLSVLSLLIAINTSDVPDSLNQRRAFWVVRYALQSEKTIENIITNVVKYKITDIFVQVRALGQVYYPSKHESSAGGISQDFDPLKIILQKAAPHKIRIHAWVNMFYIWSGVNEPKDTSHPFHRFNEYLLGAGTDPDYKSLKKEGIEGYFVDPQNLKVQNYLLNLLEEIADTYTVSGIHLDYFRYPGVSFSFTPENRTTFRMKNYFDPLDVYGAPDDYAAEYGHEVFQHADKVSRHALAESLSDYLQRINLRLKERRPNIELTVAVKPDPVVAKLRFFQGWSDWLDRDLMDMIVIMNYRNDYREFNNILLQLAEMENRHKIMIGISTYNQSEQSVNNRLRALNNYRFAGFSLFSYNHLIENQEYLSKLNLLH
jgi:uncharacterized lipoprotein YddW (UPF0748 family)